MGTLEYTVWELGIDNLFFLLSAIVLTCLDVFYFSFSLHVRQLVQYFDAFVYKEILTM